MTEHPLPDSVTTPGFVAWCADRLAPFAPLHRWFVHTLYPTAWLRRRQREQAVMGARRVR